jgi:hypothetical protein
MFRARFALILLAWSARALAQDNVDRANTLFEQAKELEKNHDIAKACEMFGESYRLAPRGGTLLNLGLCHESEGKLLAARKELKDALAMAQRDARSDRVPLATTHLAAVEARLAWLAVTAPASVDELRVDDAPIAKSDWSTVPVEAGHHVIVASSSKHTPQTLEVTVTEGEHKALSVPELVLRAETQPIPPPATKLGPRNPWKFIALGVGIAGIATSFALGGFAIEQKGILGSHCDPMKQCDQAGLDAAATGKALTIVSTVAFGIGAVGFGAFIFVPLHLTPSTASIRFTGTF